MLEKLFSLCSIVLGSIVSRRASLMQLVRSFPALHSLSAPQVLRWSVYLTNYGFCKHPSSPEIHRRQSSLWGRYFQPTLSSAMEGISNSSSHSSSGSMHIHRDKKEISILLYIHIVRVDICRSRIQTTGNHRDVLPMRKITSQRK